MVCGIYKITNKSNNKIYIGQSVDVENRIKGHKNELRRNCHPNDHLQNSFNKYGEENFEFELIKACKARYLDRFEKLQIHLNKSMNPKYGYNNESGGNSRKQVSEETRRKMSAAKIGDKNNFYGKNHSDETRKKMSKNHANVNGKNNPQNKYSLWNTEKCDYNKSEMFRNKRDGSTPYRCFRTKYNGKKLPIGMNMDFLTCEIINDLINDACKNE